MKYRFPFPPYPIGWYRVLRSVDLGRRKVRSLRYFGRDLVALRNAGGQVAVLDAHAPRSWPVTELNGVVMVWYHPRGEAPAWQVPTVPELADPRWYSAEGPHWPRIRTHVADLLENGMDLAHFSYLHRQQTKSAETLGVDVMGHEIVHRTYQRYNLFALAKLWIREVGGPLDAHLWGLGMAVNRTTVHAKIDLRYAFAFYFTPIDEEQVEVSSTLAVERQKSALVTRLLFLKAWYEGKRTLDQDVPIWEAKAYQSQPAFGERDGPIGIYRRWTRQFYEASAAEAAAES